MVEKVPPSGHQCPCPYGRKGPLFPPGDALLIAVELKTGTWSALSVGVQKQSYKVSNMGLYDAQFDQRSSQHSQRLKKVNLVKLSDIIIVSHQFNFQILKYILYIF